MNFSNIERVLSSNNLFLLSPRKLDNPIKSCFIFPNHFTSTQSVENKNKIKIISRNLKKHSRWLPKYKIHIKSKISCFKEIFITQRKFSILGLAFYELKFDGFLKSNGILINFLA
jgi:hypothetical protein